MPNYHLLIEACLLPRGKAVSLVSRLADVDRSEALVSIGYRLPFQRFQQRSV